MIGILVFGFVVYSLGLIGLGAKLEEIHEKELRGRRMGVHIADLHRFINTECHLARMTRFQNDWLKLFAGRLETEK